MSFYRSSPALPRRFRLVLASFLQQPDLPFADVITEESIQAVFDEEEVSFGDDEDSVYTPAITLWAFLSQVLFKGEHRSCVAAVARVTVLLIALHREPCSGNTGAYCRARAKLSETAIHRLATDVATGCERKISKKRLWRGRHVHLVDGTTFTMPDTPENQAVYPQQPQQAEGLGFPIARIVVLLSLATAMVTDLAMGPYEGKETGETALLRQLLERFAPGDILLADRYYCSYFMIALLMHRGVDFVTRVHQCRKVDFRRGRRLGKNDHLIEWKRPPRPAWMDPATYEQIPKSIQVREIQIHVAQPGFRTESLVVVSTLTDAGQYTRDDIAELYGRRWMAELDIRAIKITMGMDDLRCKTPPMVHKEIWTCLLAYNLIRRTLLQSAQPSGQAPRTVSFSAGLQAVAASFQVIVVCSDSVAACLVAVELENLTGHTVGHRPGRIEPRAVKRRPKPHGLLTQPREQARAKLMQAGSS